MGVKICFYPSITNEEKSEIDILKYYKNTNENGHCIYSIKAGEVCSEFIARYFFKPGTAPKKFINNIIKEDEETEKEVLKNIYKVKIEDMFQDSINNFEFKTYKECKNVREKLLNTYRKITGEIENKRNKVEIYAMLALEKSDDIAKMN